jgi:ABC-type multidrug transport system fused ATPase/permease subunit
MIIQALRKKGLTQADLAAKVGKGRPWATKILQGEIAKISTNDLRAIEDLLGISLMGVESVGSDRSSLAMDIAAAVDADPVFARLVSQIHDLVHPQAVFTPRYVPTQEMADLGRQIIALVDADREKPGKIAREVLRLLA